MPITSTSTLSSTNPPTVTSTLTPMPVISPSLIPTQTPLACWDQGGHFETGSLRSDILPLPMEYRVYLPPCYEEQPSRRYPVLYLIHGQNFNDDQWDRLGADEAADILVKAEEVTPFIIVMPRDRSWAQPTEDMFGKVLAENLIPFIDETYRTLPRREYRAVGGLSRGAGWAVHLGLSRWETFGAIGAHSLPVFWTDTRYIRTWLDAIPTESMPRIYLDIGEKDRPSIMESALWFEQLLTEKDIPHEWHLFSGYHEEAYWEAHVEGYLRWYAEGWETKP
ncbi:MAG: alpha/beta hydrolase-fold protein [Anaerolineales bacterium]